MTLRTYADDFCLTDGRKIGRWTTPTFAAGNFTASGSMTWTVAAGDVSTYAYAYLGPTTMVVAFVILTTIVGGTPNTLLKIAIPDSRTAAKLMVAPCRVSDNNTESIGYCYVDASGTVINVSKQPQANWTASTDLTFVQGQIVFEVM
jgi:hypothetical protein